MAVMRGRVTERRLFIEVEGKKYFAPKGCDPIIGPSLESVAGKEVEVLLVKDTILAIRAVDSDDIIKPPIITCYLAPPYIVFDPEILARIEPVITKSLVESGYLDENVARQLDEWQGR